MPALRVESLMIRLIHLHHLIHRFIQQALCMVALIREKNVDMVALVREKTVEFHIQSIGFLLISYLVLLCEVFHSLLVEFPLVVIVELPG